jgi:hypothetical protein
MNTFQAYNPRSVVEADPRDGLRGGLGGGKRLSNYQHWEEPIIVVCRWVSFTVIGRSKVLGLNWILLVWDRI